MLCKACSKEFELNKKKKQIVYVVTEYMAPATYKEAFNCPYCGSQNIVGDYYYPVQKKKKDEVKVVENTKNNDKRKFFKNMC